MPAMGGIDVKSIIINQNGQQVGDYYGLDFSGDGVSLVDEGGFLRVVIDGAGANPGGLSGEFQWNNSNAFAGSPGWTYDSINARPQAANGVAFTDGAFSLVLDGTPTANRAVTLPNATTTLVGRDTIDVLTNKSIDADTNTITNIENADIKAAAAIAGTKISPDFGSQDIITTGNAILGAGTKSTEGLIRIGNSASRVVIAQRDSGNANNLIALEIDSGGGSSNLYLGTGSAFTLAKMYNAVWLWATGTINMGLNGLTVAQVNTGGLACFTNHNLQLFGGGVAAPDPANGIGVFAMGNCNTAPPLTPVGGGVLYVSAGALVYKGSAGTVTPIAPA